MALSLNCPDCKNFGLSSKYGQVWGCDQCGWHGTRNEAAGGPMTLGLPGLFPLRMRDFVKETKVRHSDKQDEFETGAKRDSEEGKGCPSLISPVLIHRLGVLLQEGTKHYGTDNWMKGMKYRRTANSIIRHMFQWLAGDAGEDHLAAIAFGVMCLMHYESLPNSKLDDRCEELKKILPSILTTPELDPTLKSRGEKVCYKCNGVIGSGCSYFVGMSGMTWCMGCRGSIEMVERRRERSTIVKYDPVTEEVCLGCHSVIPRGVTCLRCVCEGGDHGTG